jgi:hypothetical protein
VVLIYCYLVVRVLKLKMGPIRLLALYKVYKKNLQFKHLHSFWMIDYKSIFYSMSIWVWVKEATEHSTPKGYAYWGSGYLSHINLVFIVRYEHYFHTPPLSCVLSKFHDFSIIRTSSDLHCLDTDPSILVSLMATHRQKVARKVPNNMDANTRPLR